MVGTILGFSLVAGAIYWLYRTKQRDFADCAAALGLALIPRGESTRGTTSEGFYFFETLLAEGRVGGLRARLSMRNVRVNASMARRNQGSQFTVLTLLRETPGPATFRLQVRGVMSFLERFMEDHPATPTGNAAFDAAYHLHTDNDAAALAVLTPALQKEILDLRTRLAGPLPDNVPGKLAAGFLIGNWEIAGDQVSYLIFGSPLKKIGDHLAQVAPLLARFAA